VPDLPRLRLSSVDPVDLDGDLLRLLAEEPRLMPHLHLSLQSGDDLILKRMKRRHLRADAIALCQEARRLRPDLVFGADLIAGFPTEDEAAFENSLSMVEACGLSYLHVFPYSPRPGTPAARMPQVDPGLRKDRAARLRDVGARARARFFQRRIGTTADVLVEKPDFGHSEHFAPVALAAAQPDTIVQTRITGATGDRLLGQAL
jgi:threonylcarbamoyladenosine tRNA methylthiotransferase MtaB